MIAGMIEPQKKRTERASFNKETGQFDVENAGSVLGIHSDRASGTLMGAGLGAIFGLPGMIVGAAIGWTAGAKKMTLSIEELAKLQEAGNQKISQNLQAGDKIQGALISRGKMAAEGNTMGIAKTNAQINMLLGQITDPEMQRALSRNAGSLQGFQKVMGQYSNKLARGAAVTNFISASKSGNVGNAGASLGVIFDNAISSGSTAQVVAIEGAFDRVDKKLAKMMSSQATAPAAFLADLRKGAGGNIMANINSDDAMLAGGIAAIVAGAVTATAIAFSGPTFGLSLGAVPMIAGMTAVGGTVGAMYGAGSEAEEKQATLREFRSQNAGAYDFLEEFHNIGALTGEEYQRLTAAFERGSLNAYELVGEVERSIENLKKTREQGTILAGKTFQLEKAFKKINRDLQFDIEIGKIRSTSDQKMRESANNFGQVFQTNRGVYDKARYGTEKRVSSSMMAENDALTIFNKTERQQLIKFTRDTLSKMNVPIDVQESLVKEFGTGKLGPGMTAPREMLEKYYNTGEFDVTRKITDEATSTSNRKTILANIGKIIALQRPQGTGIGSDLSAVFNELQTLVGGQDQESFETLIEGYLPQGAMLDFGKGLTVGASPYTLTDLGIKQRPNVVGAYDQDLANQTEVDTNLARRAEYNPDVQYSRTFEKEEADVMKDAIDAMKQRRAIYYENLTAERKGLVLREKQNLITAHISSQLLTLKRDMARQLHGKNQTLLYQTSTSERRLMKSQAFAGGSYALADPDAEMDRQVEIAKSMDDERLRQREREMVFQAKQNLAKLLSEKSVVTALDNLGDRIDALLSPLTAGTTATTKAFNTAQGLAYGSSGGRPGQAVFGSASLAGGLGPRPGLMSLNPMARKSLSTQLSLPPAAAAQVTDLRGNMKSRQISQQDKVAEMRNLEAEQMRLLERRTAMEMEVMRKFDAAQMHIGGSQRIDGMDRPADEDLNKWKELTKKRGAEEGLREFAKWKASKPITKKQKDLGHSGLAWEGDDPWGWAGENAGDARIFVDKDGEKQVGTEEWIMKALGLDRAQDGKFKTSGRGLGVTLPWNYLEEEEGMGALDMWSSMNADEDTPKNIGFKPMQLFQPKWALRSDFGPEVTDDKLGEMNIAIARALAEDIKGIWESLNSLKAAEADLSVSAGGALKHTAEIDKLRKAIAADAKGLKSDQDALSKILTDNQNKSAGSTNQTVIAQIEKGIADLNLTGARNLFSRIIDLKSANEIKKKVDEKILQIKSAPGGGVDNTQLAEFEAAARELQNVTTSLASELLGNSTKDLLRQRDAVLAKDKFLRSTKQPLGALSVLTSNYGPKNPAASTGMQLASFGGLAQPIMQQNNINDNALLSRSARANADIAALTGIRTKDTKRNLGERDIIDANSALQNIWKQQMNKEIDLTKATDPKEQEALRVEIAALKEAFEKYVNQFEKTTPRDQGIFQEFKAFGTGLKGGLAALQDDADSIYVTLGQNLPMAFRDGMVSAMTIALEKADSMSDKFRAIGIGFLQMIQQAVLKSAATRVMGLFGFGMAEGGAVHGGSGTRDDVPAMLMGGEYVMRRSAVDKYGSGFMENLNAGNYAHGGEVKKHGGGFNLHINKPRAEERKEHLNKGDDGDITTYDTVKRERPISKHLSSWARENDPSVLKFFDDKQKILEQDNQTRQEIKDRKKNKGDRETAERKALQGALLGIVAGVAAGYLAKQIKRKSKGWGAEKRMKRKIERDGYFTTPGKDVDMTGAPREDRQRYRDFINRSAQESPQLAQEHLNQGFNWDRRRPNGTTKTFSTGPITGTIAGGAPFKDANGQEIGGYKVELNRGGQVPAMLTGGEYVIGKESVEKYGPQVMSSINEGHFSGFNQGGPVGSAGSSTTNDNTKNDVNITVNVAEGGAVSESAGSSGGGATGSPEEFGKKIKAAVLDVIQQQKRVGGILR